MSISEKIFKTIRLISVCVLLLTALLTVLTAYIHFDSLLRSNIADEARIAAAGIEIAADRAEYISSLADDLNGKRITLISPDGEVIFDTQKMSEENHADRPEVAAAMETGFGDAQRNSATLGARVYYCAVRIGDGTVVRLSGETANIFRAIITSFIPLPFILIAVFIFSNIIARRLTKNIVRRIFEVDLYADSGQTAYTELEPYAGRIAAQNREIRNQMDRIEGQRIQLMNEMEEREKSEAVRREFSANVSHELKTPLTTILGFAQMINSGMAQPEDVRGFTEKIEAETLRLIALLEDIIRLSKLDENIVVEKENVNLYALAGEVIQSLEERAAEKNVEMALYGSDMEVEGNRVQLRELLYNLIENAVKYNVDGGSVAVTVENGALSVSDTGIGIPAADRDRVFERFYRVDKSRNKKISGTGLGLSIVKHIALCHNAKIKLDSSEGAGTCIRVEF